MRNNAATGLYLHIPFCASKCRYCDFYSLVGDAAQWDAFTDVLCLRMREYAGENLDTVYLGGGTPSLLGGERIAQILESVRQHFMLMPHTEITVECNPDSMTEDLLLRMKLAGVNRISIGVQSAKDDELSRLGRRHTFSQVMSAFGKARQFGFDNISLDLMYGLPNQTEESFLYSVDTLLSLGPEHLSCYGLKLEPNTPMGWENPVLPDDDEQAKLYLALCERLSCAEYEHYEISNWAKTGFRSQHNMKYWRLAPYLGLGPAAHSLYRGRRFAFSRDSNAFLRGDPPVPEEQTTVSAEEEALMLSLRTADGVDKRWFERQFGHFSAYEKRFRALSAHGLTEQTSGGWRLTERGFLVSNLVISDISNI